MSACTRLHCPGSLSQVSAPHHSAVLTRNIGCASTLKNKFLPFAARPLCTSANQARGEEQVDGDGKGSKGGEQNGNVILKVDEQSDGDRDHKGGEKADGNASGNVHEGSTTGNGHQGSEASGGNGHRGNWNGFENFVLYTLTEQRKAQSAEYVKLLEESYKLQGNIESFRTDTVERIHKAELLMLKTALKVLMAIVVVLVWVVQFTLPYTPEGKALRERLMKVFQGETEEETK